MINKLHEVDAMQYVKVEKKYVVTMANAVQVVNVINGINVSFRELLVRLVFKNMSADFSEISFR